jgi:Putative phage serine protease XkdF
MNNKFNPTSAVKDNISRGVALSKKYPRESLAGQQRLQQVDITKSYLENGFDLEAVKNIYNTLTKLEKSVNFDTRLWDNGYTDDVIKYYAHGGKAGLAWSRLILKEQGMLGSYKKDITTAETEETGKDSLGTIGVLKAVDEMQRMATFVVLEPQDDSGFTSDLHGDYYDAQTVEKACRSFNNQCKKANLFHAIETTAFTFVESYITPADMVINETFIKKGTWLATIQVSEEPEYEFIWQGILSGEFNGLSIQAMGTVEHLTD